MPVWPSGPALDDTRAPMPSVAGDAPAGQLNEFNRTYLLSPSVALSQAESGLLLLNNFEGEMWIEVTEFELFAAGEKRVITPLGEKEFEGRFFRGHIAGEPNSTAYAMVAPTGIYGVVELNGTAWSYQPIVSSTSATDQVLQELKIETVWDAPPQFSPPVLAMGPMEVASTTSAETTSSTNRTIYVKPFADAHYPSYTTDWAERISAAYGYSEAMNMWESETATAVRLFAVQSTSNVFSQSASGCGGYADSGLDSFGKWLKAEGGGGTTGKPHASYMANSHGLFFAKEPSGGGVMGCGFTGLQGPGTLDATVTHTIVAKDWYPGLTPGTIVPDTYDPDDVRDFALAVHHELTHNAGEEGHPNATLSGWGTTDHWNLMAHRAPASYMTGFWRTPQTIINMSAELTARASTVRTLANSGDPTSWDATSYRGKKFSSVPSGVIAEICILAKASGTSATIAVRETETGPVLMRDVIQVKKAGAWNCASFGHWPKWTTSTLFVYKESGTAEIAVDSGAPNDGRASSNSGSTWSTEANRRGFLVRIVTNDAAEVTEGSSPASFGTYAYRNAARRFYTPDDFITKICVYPRTTSAGDVYVNVKESDSAGAPTIYPNLRIPLVTAGAWNCANMGLPWTADMMFVTTYADLGYTTSTTGGAHDSFTSTDGVTWSGPDHRVGIRVVH